MCSPDPDNVSQWVLGMTLPLAYRAQIQVRRDDDKSNSLRSTKNRFGLHCHPLLCLSVETRPMILEDHRYGLRLVQG